MQLEPEVIFLLTFSHF